MYVLRYLLLNVVRYLCVCVRVYLFSSVFFSL